MTILIVDHHDVTSWHLLLVILPFLLIFYHQFIPTWSYILLCKCCVWWCPKFVIFFSGFWFLLSFSLVSVAWLWNFVYVNVMFVSMFTYVRFSDPLSTNVNVISEFRVVGLVSSAYALGLLLSSACGFTTR